MSAHSDSVRPYVKEAQPNDVACNERDGFSNVFDSCETGNCLQDSQRLLHGSRRPIDASLTYLAIEFVFTVEHMLQSGVFQLYGVGLGGWKQSCFSCRYDSPVVVKKRVGKSKQSIDWSGVSEHSVCS